MGKRSKKAARKRVTGMSLIEVLIAGVILLIIVMGLMDASMLGMRGEKTATTKTMLTIVQNQALGVLGTAKACAANFVDTRAGAFDPTSPTLQSLGATFSINYVSSVSAVAPFNATLGTTKVVGVGDSIGSWKILSMGLLFKGPLGSDKFNVDIVINASESSPTSKVFGSQTRDLILPAVFTMDSSAPGAKTIDCAVTGSGGGGGSGEVPKDAVMAFDLDTCPTGWSDYSAGAGRTILGAGEYKDCADGGTPCTVSTSLGCPTDIRCVPTMTPACPAHCIAQTPLNYSRNDKGGQAKVQLKAEEGPPHIHGVRVKIDDRMVGGPATLVANWSGAKPASATLPTTCALGSCGDGNFAVDPNFLDPFPGGLQPTDAAVAHENRPPYVTLKYCKKD